MSKSSIGYDLKREYMETRVRFELIHNPSNHPMPIVVPTPEYPQEALKEKTEGWVTLTYTINSLGRAIDIKVVENSGADIFNEPSINATKKLAFRQAIKNGETVPVYGVKSRYIFELVK